MDLTDKTQLRDAIGHHLSHYKAALKAHHAAPEGTPEKDNFRKVADSHIEKALPLLHLAGKAAHHSKGQLMLKYPSMMPWESNYTSMKRGNSRGGTGLHRDPKGLGAHEVLSRNAKDYGIPNYHYFEMPPNPGHPKVANMSFTGGYPWEEIQLGSPEDVDAKKAHLHIEDVPASDKHEEHAFDKHPISKSHKIRSGHMTEDLEAQYGKELAEFRSTPHHEKWMADHEAQYEKDPEAFEKRGHTKAPHFYEGIPLKEQRPHVNDYPHVTRAAPSDASWEVEGQANAGGAAAAKTPGMSVRKKKEAKPAGDHPLEGMYQAWKKLPKEHQDSILHTVPGFSKYVADKGGE
jgi:hypothetical protein